MSKVHWHCTEVGVDGWLLIAADQDLTGPNDPESMFGFRRAFHPFQLDEDPQALAKAVLEMSEVMGRASAFPLPASRACAFGDPHEAATSA